MMRRCGHCGEVFFPELPYPTHPGPAVAERHGRALCPTCLDDYERLHKRRQRETENILAEFANTWRSEP